MWLQVDGLNYGAKPIGDFFTETGSDHATDVIEAMWAGLNKPFFINTANAGAVGGMPDNAFLEL
jgi:alpha-galactosidase/6-phospho-beta-glucosidase family protein